MKRFLFFCLLTFTILVASAQQAPFLSNYIYNYYYVNPAYVGSLYSADVSASTRQQWVGLEGAPQTYAVTGHTPLPTLEEKLSVGALIINDQVGPENNLYFAGDVGYQIKFDRQTLSFGMRGGLVSFSNDLTSLSKVDNADGILAGSNSETKPQVGAGLYLFSEHYFLGVSVPQILQHKFQNTSLNTVASERSYYVGGGLVLGANPDYKFKITSFAQFAQSTPLDVTIAPSILMHDRLWFGAHFRNSMQIGFMSRVHLSEKLRVGYIFEYPLNSSNDLSPFGTHEIMVGYNFEFFESRYKLHGKLLKHRKSRPFKNRGRRIRSYF